MSVIEPIIEVFNIKGDNDRELSNYSKSGDKEKQRIKITPNELSKFSTYDIAKLICVFMIMINSIITLWIMEKQLYFKMFFSDQKFCPAFGSVKRCITIITYSKVSIVCCVVNVIYSYILMINYHFFHRFLLKYFAYFECPLWVFVGIEWMKLYKEVCRWVEETGASGQFTIRVVNLINYNFILYVTMGSFCAAEYQKLVFIGPIWILLEEIYSIISAFMHTE
mmetsp:Transcript_9877/g.22579  ORF Transcript_9877/g.22579 Transcript_9877/m.22579 type:complete len:223 (+) Transcript_9877:1324-1992(+)